MSESDPNTSRGPGSSEEPEKEPEVASTPFDGPYFLPVLLLGFTLWFTYDGWFNPEMEWVKFNRVGAPILALLTIYFFVKAVRESRAERDDAPDSGA